jgi:hypothetical protein
MLYSKNRKNLTRARTKRSKLMSFINNRFRIQDEKWEDVDYKVNEMDLLFNTVKDVNTL